MKAIVIHTIQYERGERVQKTFRSRTFDTKDAMATFKAMCEFGEMLTRDNIMPEHLHSAEFVKGSDWRRP